ncbi:MAG: bifunctional shikimate kinase/3-dehydroquinate synthase [Acidimicrobiales bacterium]
MTSHVVLVGLMGVGKTTVGRRVGRLLDRDFVDADAALEAREGRTVRDLFTLEGEGALRAVETEVLAQLLAHDEPQVIAAGGGVVVTPANRKLLGAAGVCVVWLHGDAQFLASRATRKDSRPLLDGDDAAATLERLATEREPWYREVADIVVDVQAAYEGHAKPKAKDRIAGEVAARVHEREVDAARPGLHTITVPLGDRAYDVIVGPGARRVLSDVLPVRARRAAVVTQERIGFDVDPGIEHQVFTLPDGEEGKALSNVEDLCRAWSRWGLTRDDVVVAVGGGVVTDVAGFAAAVHLRGLPVVNVSTTLLGMVDAAIGGKTGVNLPEGKNLVGAFWQPAAVLCDTDALATLAPRELRSGWGEVAKYHFLTDADLDAMDDVERIAACVRIKANVVAADEREGGRRALLNYGHTLAHALETVGEYDLRHGEAVGIGLVFAAALAHRYDRIDLARVHEHLRIVRGYGLPTALPDGIDIDELLAVIARDKKAVDGITFVLDSTGVGLEVVAGLPEGDVRDALVAFDRQGDPSS